MLQSLNKYILLVVGLPLSSAVFGAIDPAREQQAFTIGTEAYVYGLPIVNMYLKRQAHLKLGPVNQFRHVRDVISPGMEIVSPNEDVLYSIAWLDLRDGPVLLTLPDSANRYFSFQTVTFFTDNGSYASSRTQAGEFRRMALIGPGWTGKLPSGVQRLDCKTMAVGLIGRTFVAGTNDLATARALQDQYQLSAIPPARLSTNAVYPPFDPAEPLSFFAILDQALRENPPTEHDADAVAAFKPIGIGAVVPVDESLRAGLTRALVAGQQRVENRAKTIFETAGGWVMSPANLGRYGTNYLLRAAAASIRLGVNSPRECFYLSASVDDHQQPLQSDHRYVLRFEKDKLPPAKAFWSVTMYRLPDRHIVSNALGRVNLHSLDTNLQYGADGSLEILLQKDSPGAAQESNWLPAPDGQFRIVLRLYDPPLSVIKREWLPPVPRRER